MIVLDNAYVGMLGIYRIRYSEYLGYGKMILLVMTI